MSEKIVKEKVLAFANKVSKTKVGSKNGVTVDDPRYYILEPVVTEEMAEVALCMDFRQPRSAEELAELCGKTPSETYALAMELAVAGVCFVNEKDGVDKFWYETWVPGIMEMMVNNYDNVIKYPQIAQAFEAYGKITGPKCVGIFPMGVGVMRVIPVQKAIEGETRRADYEEISKYLEENDIFSVSHCSCRTSREIMGEGCGHLKEDMCLQMGHAAEYYIRTGRGRKISREEAYEIVIKAEENGLMHQIPNLDGSGIAHAICNCCGCSCFAMRIANMFGNNDMIRSNYRAVVDTENCVACGKCVENCPTNAAKLGQKICGEEPIVPPQSKTPRNHEWKDEDFNPDYRINRQDVVDTGTSPCKTECPAHIGIQGYIRLASQGKYKEALELIKYENPFPAVCGRICPKGCESACTRGEIDNPVAIDEVKKFVAEQDMKDEYRFLPKKRHDYSDKKIAIVGAGPAGLSCAYYLSIDGYTVTVFEKEKMAGGMLTFGIPSFRLEKDVIEAEIDVIRRMGVEIKTGVEVGKDITLDHLRKEGYTGFYIATGAQGGKNLGIEGEDNPDVYTGIDFLRDVNLGGDITLSGNVVVIGGGNVAIDVARTAKRIGGENVTMFCLESREEMPALDEEIEEALEEKIEVSNSWGPTKIVVENGKITGVEFRKCTSVFDEMGKFSPSFDDENTILIPANHVIVSVGQTICHGSLFDNSKVKFNMNDTVVADSFTYQTDQPDVFVGGDCYTGPKFAIDAIAAGKQGAISLHRFVQKGQSLVYGRDRREYISLNKDNLIFQGYDATPRQEAGHNKRTSNNFSDDRKIFSEEQLKKETERCLGCGATYIDEYRCVGCGQCTTQCSFDAIKLERVYDNESLPYEKVKPAVIKTMIKRKGRITATKIKEAIGGGASRNA